MFYIDLWGFSIDPPYFGHYRIRNTCFMYFDISGTFRNSNWPMIFMAWIFLHEKKHKDKKYESGPPGPKRA
jgi:hypothetical protein